MNNKAIHYSFLSAAVAMETTTSCSIARLPSVRQQSQRDYSSGGANVPTLIRVSFALEGDASVSAEFLKG